MSTRPFRGLSPSSLTQSESFLPVAAITMEVCALYPWALWLSQVPGLGWQGTPVSLVSTIAILSLAYLSTTLGEGRRLKALPRIAMLLGNFLVLAFVLRLEHNGGISLWESGWPSFAAGNKGVLIAGAVYGVYILFRGVSLGREPIAFDRLYRSFTIGLVSLGVVLLLWSFGAASDSWPAVTGNVGVLVACFFFAGLSGLALSNYVTMQTEARRIAKRAPSLSRRWTVLALLIALVVSILGFSIANASSLDPSILRTPFLMAANAIGLFLVYVIGYPLGYIAAGLIFAFKWFLSLVAKDAPKPEFQLPQAFRPARDPDQVTGANTELLLKILVAAEWALLVLAIALGFFLLVRFYLKGRSSRPNTDFDETSESLWSKEEFLSGLKNFLRGIKASLRKKIFPPGSQDAAPVLARGREDTAGTLGLRAMYQALLTEGRRTGNGKKEAETPHEYASRLGTRFPVMSKEVHVLTEEYVLERYAHLPAPTEKISALNDLWRRVRTLFPKIPG